MATATGTPPDQHQAAQTALTTTLAALLAKLWPNVDMARLKETLPDFYDAVVALVQHYSAASSALARQHYQQMRRDAGITDTFRIPTVAGPTREDVMRDLVWSTENLWGKQSLTDADLGDMALTKAQATTGRLVLNTGRDQIAEAATKDRRARGYVREARPDACWWCAMLATRSVLYESRATAGEISATKVLGPDAKGTLNSFHTHCHCKVVPVFGKYEPTAKAREWQDLWISSTSGVTGSKAKQRAFQEALEGRVIKRRS